MVKTLLLKNFSGLLLVTLLFVSMASWGQATIVNYDFNAGASYAALTSTNATNVNSGVTGTETFTTFTGVASGNQAFTANSTPGQAIAMNNSSGTNTKYFTFSLSGSALSSYTAYKVYFQTQRSASGAQSVTLFYSTDGTSFTSFGSSTVATSFNQNLFDLSAITAINNASTVYFRIAASGASSTGTLRLDNFQVNATLAPSGAVATPTISASGTANGTDTFWSTASITLATTTPGATIYYTTDGSAPTTSSTAYSSPFNITTTGANTIKAIATASGLTDSAVATKTITITTPPTAALPYTQAFANTLGTWTNFSITGNKPWLANTNGANANGFNVNPSVESWLVSPKLTGVTNGLAIAFDYQILFTGGNLDIVYSTNYDGYSAPSTATWASVTSIPATATAAFTNTGSLSVPATANVHIAFKYTGAFNNYSGWYIKNFTAALSAPAVTTTQVVTDVTTITSAASGGTIPFANGTVSHKGVVWGTSANPTTALTTKTDEGTGSSTFTSTLTPLLSNSLYYYRAYAENENGTAYGTEYSFTTRSYAPGTPVVSNPNSSTLDVTINENGNNAATKYAIRVNGGIYTNYFVQANGSVNSTEVFQTVAEWGNTTVTVNGLAPETAYTFDVRARNTATALTNYSATASGTTTESTVPSLVLVSASLDFGSICLNAVSAGSFSFTGENLSTNATLGVGALDGYSYSLTEGGTYTSTLTISNYDGSALTVYVHLTPTAAQSYDGTLQVDGQGADSTAVLDLATTGTGINTPGTVTTGATTGSEVTAATAILHATSTSGCSSLSAYGFEYSTTPGFANGTGTPATASNLSGGAFSAALSALAPNTTYFYTAFITDGAGTHYGSQLSFSTESLDAPDATAGTAITQTSFTANWVAVEGAESYRLDVSTLPAFGTGNLATDLFISQYSEGSANNKYIEIYNGTGHNVDLSGYKLDLYANGSATISTSVTLSGTLAHGQVVVYKNGGANVYTGATTTNLAVNFNGDDTMVLAKTTGEYVDIFGRIGSDPGTAWTATGYSTLDKVLVRKPSVISGVSVNPTNDISGGATNGFPTLATEWDISNIDIVTDFGSHTGNFVLNLVSGYDNLTVAGTSQAVTGLTANTNYYYRVRAYSTASTSDNSDAITVLTAPDTITWMVPDGLTAPEWVPNLTPDNTLSAVISADYDTATYGGFTANNLTVSSGYAFTVNPNTTVTVYGSVTNSAGVDNFVVEDNGALVQRGTGTNATPVTVIKNSNPLYRLDYTLWSAPTTGQTLRQFSLGTSNNRFYEYVSSDTEDEGYYPVDPLTTYFDAASQGKGFLIRMPNAVTENGTTFQAAYAAGDESYTFEGTFKGAPNTGDITYPLFNEGGRYTAIGNPYPSPINLAAFYSANTAVIDQGSAIYFWRKRNSATTTGSYATLTLADFNANDSGDNEGDATGGQDNEVYFPGATPGTWAIAPGQGFIVQTDEAAPATPEVTFTNTMRQAAPSSGGQAFFKSGVSQASRFRMKVTTPAGGSSQMSVVYMPQGTLGIDYGYDGKKLAESGVSLYTFAQNTILSIQARPEFEVTDVVPVGFTAVTAGSHTIALSHTDGVFANGQKIYLKDNAEGVIRDMSLGGYTFTSEAGAFEGRFEVVYTTAALGTTTPVLDANTVIVYQNGGTININSGTAVISSVNVFDIRGRKLYSADKVNTTEAAISNLAAAQQVLVIEIHTDKGTVAKKIVF